MRPSSGLNLLGLAIAIFLGLAALGYLLGRAAIEVKEYERSVTAKGLSEREYPADVVIWPVAFTVAGNDLGQVYAELDSHSRRVREFLQGAGLGAGEISFSTPTLTDDPYQYPVQYRRLGKIRRASQGKFTIEPRDTTSPQLKKVRVVSTVEYYLSD
jgi:hypothetical protein